MKTQIFKSKQEFLTRTDKDINGVDSEFAQACPDYEKQNETNKACWRCSGCSRCSRCSRLKNAAPVQQDVKESRYPIIPKIHQTILDAVKLGHLKMSSWHESEAVGEDGAYCGTTHCRAWWVVAKAGKAGRELESLVGTSHAAMMIYNTSCHEIPVSPVRFHKSNEIAMADIVRCAQLEANLKPGTE